MNRGSLALRILRSTDSPRFNEAPIHESGKCRIGEPPRPSRRGFNEAPIHESGK